MKSFKKPAMLLFDLDDTLLRTDKTLSKRTFDALCRCRDMGILIGICTSRAEQNCRAFLPSLTPDLMIVSGGSVVYYQGKVIYSTEYSAEETRAMIASARRICGEDCEITIDTLTTHYWNYKVDPNEADATWGETVYTDYSDFSEKALKMCVQIFDLPLAAQVAACIPDCDYLKFTGSHWHKFTKKSGTKKQAMVRSCDILGIDLKDVIAFGDDAPDIGMLQLCGTGVAMGNAIPSVKEAADIVIGTNDEDGIAIFLESIL